ncbi:MAG: L,D-transpeptidase [Pseudomonadota bacterium]
MLRAFPRLIALLLLNAAPVVAPAWAQDAPPPAPAAPETAPPATIEEAVARLKPGEFLWLPEVAPRGPVMLVVSLATQRAIVYRNGVPIAVTTVSTGRPGHRTPAGIYTVLQKEVKHFSSIYDNAPMPYMQRLTWGGIALHGGHLPGYPASHGCIRLPHEFAKLLYGVTALGMTVVVTDEAAVPRVAPSPSLFGGGGDGASADAAQGVQWHPERAPTGPVSIVLSGADARVVVLRNGVEIGSAPVVVDPPVAGTTLYTLQSVDGAAPRWLRIPIGAATAGEAVPAEEARRFSVDEGFRAAVRGVLVPGTTVVVTADSLRAAPIGANGEVLQDE